MLYTRYRRFSCLRHDRYQDKLRYWCRKRCMRSRTFAGRTFSFNLRWKHVVPNPPHLWNWVLILLLWYFLWELEYLHWKLYFFRVNLCESARSGLVLPRLWVVSSGFGKPTCKKPLVLLSIPCPANQDRAWKSKAGIEGRTGTNIIYRRAAASVKQSGSVQPTFLSTYRRL